jgi:hypothetical protein
MMAPSVGTIWFPTPTKAWAAARSRVFRLTMLGGAGTRRPSRGSSQRHRQLRRSDDPLGGDGGMFAPAAGVPETTRTTVWSAGVVLVPCHTRLWL